MQRQILPEITSRIRSSEALGSSVSSACAVIRILACRSRIAARSACGTRLVVASASSLKSLGSHDDRILHLNRQDQAGRTATPSTITVHAPQAPWAQPTWVPVRRDRTAGNQPAWCVVQLHLDLPAIDHESNVHYKILSVHCRRWPKPVPQGWRAERVDSGSCHECRRVDRRPSLRSLRLRLWRPHRQRGRPGSPSAAAKRLGGSLTPITPISVFVARPKVEVIESRNSSKSEVTATASKFLKAPPPRLRPGWKVDLRDQFVRRQHGGEWAEEQYAAGTNRLPDGPTSISSPSQATAMPGISAASSACARLPPTVPRLRIE